MGAFSLIVVINLLNRVHMNDFGNLIVLLCLFFASIECGPAVDLTVANFDSTINKYDLVLVDFHARWCKFSRMLDPIFDEASEALEDLHKVGISVSDASHMQTTLI